MTSRRTTTLAGEAMTAQERRVAGWLAGVFSLRMLGLFMILPVFALYAEHLDGATPALAGLAIGIYGLAQAIFQIPFGLLSDRFERKQIIIVGLVIFALGSVVAALATSINGVILGRALQGMGAISAAVMALAADLTREEHRTKVMATIGVSIGVSFAVSMVAGPVLNGFVGVPGIFWITALLALGGIGVVKFLVPDPFDHRLHRDAQPVPAQFLRVLRDPQLLRLDAGIFALHLILTATFVAVPHALKNLIGMPASTHWELYLPTMVLGMGAMVPFVIVAEKQRRLKQVFLGAIALLGVAEVALVGFHAGFWSIGIAMFLFFTAFNLLEATLPSLVAKMAPPDAKGTAMGFYASTQFLGAFCGGALGGWLHGRYGLAAVFQLCALVALGWLALAATMKNPRYLSSYLLNVGAMDEAAAQRLGARLTEVRGVAEAVVSGADGVAYLKIDRHALDEPALLAFSVSRPPA
ncbi:MAG TPA: MFS transporter [Plasticicumulans sp.]|uniref:MFS transporter n=1 Tax=Plasticicumulans sp. TaxID=2307179 RepID=UPI002B56BFB7|nr:MFS transporter [Plasticicumulans sp.]HMV39802.1 MFS transporter [Plasticicumulans sp.]HMW31119.1 MFS transporter [Plasticicumulans sp.]HMW42414.1 MFS transporter [Plasticicumulans sp.]HMX52775.1 MFS transporter [Plasticicumulans sp.]HMZ10172.1 MFS transporter [Plasticicumulans sp.]